MIYLAGPINGCSDSQANDWRGWFRNHTGHRFLDPMRRDYRGREDDCVAEIVNGDITDIDDCTVFLANCWQVSRGTAMEIFYAYRAGKYVILVVPEGQRISPWLRYHSHHIVATLDEAAELL